MSINLRAIAAIIVGGLILGVTEDVLADSFINRMMNIFGITASPGQLKGNSDTAAGRLWITNIESGASAGLTSDSGYRWPVYEPGGASLVALKGDAMVRIPAHKGKTEVLHLVPGVDKLVGFDRSDPDKLLVVVDNGTAPIAVLSLNSGKLAALPYNAKSDEHRLMLSHARSEERAYGTTRVKVKRESRKDMEGTVEWTDVFVQRGTESARNVSNCGGDNCGQPSLSPGGNEVVFVRASPY